MKDIRVSVIITTHNRPSSFERAFESVMAQRFKWTDLNVIDDASDEDVGRLVQQKVSHSERAHYHRQSICKGLAAARNEGIARSMGNYIAFLDDDDEWKPDCLQKRVDILRGISADEFRRTGVVYCGCEVRHRDEKRTSFNLPAIKGEIKESICSQGLSTIPSSCLFPKRILEGVGGFDETLPSCIDHDIWMKIALEGCHAIPVMEPLVVTYEERRRKCMVNDTLPRICGVERYISKWAPALMDWMGEGKGREYMDSYRSRVLGELASRKFYEGDYKEARRLYAHIISQSCSPGTARMVTGKIFFRDLLRHSLPRPLIESAKRLLCR